MKKLYWNDPEPIEDNEYLEGTDYEVNSLVNNGEIYLITYNSGQSEAEVLGSELELR